MSLVYWNPFREVSLFDVPMDRSLQERRPSFTEAGERASWAPLVDVYETDDHELVVSAELPGVDRNDVTVTLENGVLTIEGERKREVEGQQGRQYRAERTYGEFRRSLAVPRTVDAAAVAAEHKDGTLRVRLPLKKEAQPHRIAVKAA